MYSLKEFLKQEPAGISAGVVALLNVAVLLGLPLSADVLAAVDVAAVGILNLFYVRLTTVTKTTLDALAKMYPGGKPPPHPLDDINNT